MREPLKVSVSGVRGVVGESLSPQAAASFAQAFGTFIGRGAVVLGRDTRTTGLMLEHAVAAGLQSVGCKPVLVGIAPTPTILHLTLERGARGGIAITASHNSSRWNALKFVDHTGLFLNETRAEELFDIYHQQEFPLVGEADLPTPTRLADAAEGHFRKVLDYIDPEPIRRRGFRVAVDCCNGVGAVYSAPFLRDLLGCEVFPVFDAPNGVFEREPEPLPEHLDRLRETVISEHCDIGFAQDPDGDRLAIVNERGEPLGEDLSLAFAVRRVLEAHEKGPVVVNLSTSKMVDHVAGQFGCEVVRTRIGEINVADGMLAAGAVVGGEANGGVMIPGIHPCRDSFAGMAIVLELLAATGQTVSELRAEVPVYHVAKLKIPARTEQAPGVLRAIRRHYKDEQTNLLDGVHVDFGDRWVHVRRSNTEPVIRVTAEAPTAGEAQELVQQLRERVTAELS